MTKLLLFLLLLANLLISSSVTIFAFRRLRRLPDAEHDCEWNVRMYSHSTIMAFADVPFGILQLWLWRQQTGGDTIEVNGGWSFWGALILAVIVLIVFAIRIHAIDKSAEALFDRTLSYKSEAWWFFFLKWFFLGTWLELFKLII